MPAGRPTVGLEHIDRVQGSFEAKHRLRTIVETIVGDVSVVEACKRLGIGASRFHVIRNDAIQAAVTALEPHCAGRPRQPGIAEDVRRLETQVHQQDAALRRERARAEVALIGADAVLRGVRGGQSRSG